MVLISVRKTTTPHHTTPPHRGWLHLNLSRKLFLIYSVIRSQIEQITYKNINPPPVVGFNAAKISFWEVGCLTWNKRNSSGSFQFSAKIISNECTNGQIEWLCHFLSWSLQVKIHFSIIEGWSPSHKHTNLQYYTLSICWYWQFLYVTA